MNNRSNINIKGNNQVFNYLIEYAQNDEYINGSSVNWHIDNKDIECIHLLCDDIKYYRYRNDWYMYEKENTINQYVPNIIELSN